MTLLSSDKDSLRRDRGALESALRNAGSTFKGGAVKCPFHDDAHPSGSIHQDEKGVWRFKCHTATCGFYGDVYDVRARVAGKKPEDLLRELHSNAQPKPKPKVYPDVKALKSAHSSSAEYTYSHPETGVIEMVVLRCPTTDGGKTFLQASPCEGGFHLKAPKKPWPLYNRTRVKNANSIVVVEGEKCVHALKEIGVVATTSPGGALNAGNADWLPLAGKTVYLWPDNDDAGQSYMRKVAEILEKLDPPPAKISLVSAGDFGLPSKGDVVEYLELYGGGEIQSQRNAIANALDISIPIGGASSGVKQIIEDTISGKRSAVPWPYPCLSRLTKSLLPATVTALCGDPGDGKSIMVVEAGAYWHRLGIKVAIKMMEEDQAYHLLRALAQVSGDARVIDDEWVKDHPDEARAIFTAHQKFLDEFGRCIYAAPDTCQTLDELAAWVEHVAASGSRVIVIDPITMAQTSAKPWVDDLQFLTRAKITVRKYGASLVLVTHPRKGNRTGSPSLHDLAGGAAYQRFVQTVMWVRRFDHRKLAKCHGIHGPFETKLNRSVKLGKTRNGRGGGLEIGFDFSGGTFRFAEQGVVVKWIKEKSKDADVDEGVS